MKILVTGGTGFTGKALIRRLLHDGHSIVALDNKEGINTDELRDWGAEVIIGSVTDKELVKSLMPGMEVVFHIAAAFRELNVDDNYYEEVNIEGTRNVVNAAQLHAVQKVVVCSTCGVHGNVDNPPAAEDAPIAPADYYQRTKYEGELVALEAHKKGLNVTVLRPAAIYGPGDPDRFGMIFRRVNKHFFPIFGDGQALYHPLYIDNFIDALIAVMQPDVGNGEVYLIADEQYLTTTELVNKVAAALDTRVRLVRFPFWPVRMVSQVVEKACKPLNIVPPIFPRRVDWYKQNRAFDISKAKREIGYKPSIGLDEGLRKTAEWYKNEGYL